MKEDNSKGSNICDKYFQSPIAQAVHAVKRCSPLPATKAGQNRPKSDIIPNLTTELVPVTIVDITEIPNLERKSRDGATYTATGLQITYATSSKDGSVDYLLTPFFPEIYTAYPNSWFAKAWSTLMGRPAASGDNASDLVGMDCLIQLTQTEAVAVTSGRKYIKQVYRGPLNNNSKFLGNFSLKDYKHYREVFEARRS